MKTWLFTLCFLCTCFISIGQLETSHWFLNSNHLTVTQAGVAPGNPPGFGAVFNPITASTSVSDSSGNLIFGSDGYRIINKNYSLMPGITNVSLNSNGNKMLAIRVPSSTRYYLFYNSAPSAVQNPKWTLRYAVIDMSLQGGLGDVVSVNQLVDVNLSQGFTLAQGEGTEDCWLVTHRAETDTFLNYKITSAGLAATPVVSRAGSNPILLDYLFADLKTSPNGKIIGGISYRNYTTNFAETYQYLELFNFNPATGLLTNRVRTPRSRQYYFISQTVEFSPDNRLVYAGFMQRIFGLQPCGFGGGSVIQYNLCYTDSLSFNRYGMYVLNKFFFCGSESSWGRIQLGADKRIYMPFSGNTISTFDHPNRIGSSSTFNFQSYQTTSGNLGKVVAPAFPHRLVEKAVKNNIVYDGGCFPSPLIFRITNDTIMNISWNFGDPASGAANTSTAVAPAHVFSAPGFYTVSATLRNSLGQVIEVITDLLEIKNPNRRLLADYPRDTSICDGVPLRLKLSVVNGIFHWKQRIDSRIGDYGTSDSIETYSAGTYIVEMRQNDCNGCVMVDSIVVNVLPRPYVNLPVNQRLCQGDSLRLGPFDPAGSYVWSTGQTSNAIWAHTGGTFWVRGEYNNNGCINSDTIIITSVPGVAFSLPRDTVLCTNQALLLNPGVANANYYWQNGSTATTFNVTQAGTYWVRIFNNDFCTRSDTIHVSYINAQGVNLGADTSLCLGDSIRLQTGVQNAQYLWSTGALTPSITIYQSGTYWVQVNNGSCTVTDTIRVAFNPPPQLSLGNDLSLCQGERRVLRPGIPNASYLWHDGSVADTFAVIGAGLIWVEAKKGGCTVRDSLQAIVRPLPPLNLGSDAVLCAGSTLILSATHLQIQSYNWQNGSTGSQLSVSTPGIYWVTAEGINGCFNRDTIIVNGAPLPQFNLGSDTTLCSGQSRLYVFSMPGASYQWSDGSTQSTNALAQAGWHWLEVEQNGCSRRDSVQVSIKATPIVQLGADTTLCEGANHSLQALTAGATYLWNTGSSSSTIIIDKPALYFVTVDLVGCIAKDSIQISYTYLPRFTLGADTTLCKGQNFLLDPRISSGQFLWQDGSINSTYRVSLPGTYALTISNNCGSKSDAITVEKGLCQLYMPDAFTPGRDGKNDVFRVKYPQFIKAFQMRIFNRWGQVVYSSTDPLRGWNGKLNNIDQPMDNYIWTITLTDLDGVSNSFKGSVVLIR